MADRLTKQKICDWLDDTLIEAQELMEKPNADNKAILESLVSDINYYCRYTLDRKK